MTLPESTTNSVFPRPETARDGERPGTAGRRRGRSTTGWCRVGGRRRHCEAWNRHATVRRLGARSSRISVRRSRGRATGGFAPTGSGRCHRSPSHGPPRARTARGAAARPARVGSGSSGGFGARSFQRFVGISSSTSRPGAAATPCGGSPPASFRTGLCRCSKEERAVHRFARIMRTAFRRAGQRSCLPRPRGS